MSLDLVQEVVRLQDLLDLWALVVCFIRRVLVVDFLGADRLPLLDCDEHFVEDFLSVNLDESAIAVVSDTTSVVALSDDVLDCLPWNLGSLRVGIRVYSTFTFSSEITSNGIFANLVIAVVERVADIPTESLKLFTFNENSVEPAQTKHRLSEISGSVALGKRLALVAVEARHVSLDTTRWLLSDLKRSLKQRNGEVGVGRGRQE